MSEPKVRFGRRVKYCENHEEGNIFLVCKEEPDGTISELTAYADFEAAIAICNMRCEFIEKEQGRVFIMPLNIPYSTSGLIVFGHHEKKSDGEDDLCYTEIKPVIDCICSSFELCYTSNAGNDYLGRIQKDISRDETAAYSYFTNYVPVKK